MVSPKKSETRTLNKFISVRVRDFSKLRKMGEEVRDPNAYAFVSAGVSDFSKLRKPVYKSETPALKTLVSVRVPDKSQKRAPGQFLRELLHLKQGGKFDLLKGFGTSLKFDKKMPSCILPLIQGTSLTFL